MDEMLMPRYINDAHLLPRSQRQKGKAEVYGHTALFLLGQPVWVYRSQELHQAGFAVVYVPRRTYGQHNVYFSCIALKITSRSFLSSEG